MNARRTDEHSLTVVLPEDDPSLVYMIYCGGQVKIGVTKDLDRRLSQIRHTNPSPVSLVWLIKGDRKTERVLHKRFADVRQRGEWFKISDDMREFLASRTKSILNPIRRLDWLEAHPNQVLGPY